MPTFAFVFSITVLTICALNCGSLKTQYAFNVLILDLILIIRLGDGGCSGLSNMDPIAFKL